VLSAGHHTHRPLASTELAFVRDLTQRVCFAGAWAAQNLVPRDYDVFDDVAQRQVTARRVLAVGAAARRRASAASDAVTYRRHLVAHRMVPNVLRPLADARLLALVLVLLWAAGSLLGLGVSAWWCLGAGLLAWLGLPRLPPHYRVSNLAALPRELELEVVEAASTGPLGTDFTRDDDFVDGFGGEEGEDEEDDDEGEDESRDAAINELVNRHGRPLGGARVHF